MDGFATTYAGIREGISLLLDVSSLLVGTWFFAGIFAISGLVKVRQPLLAAMAIVDFGVARRVRPWMGLGLGIGEMLLALALGLGALVGGMLVWLAMTVAALVLWFFATLIARSLHAGENFSCFCFGNNEAGLSWWTLFRTLTLAMLASVVAIGLMVVHPPLGLMVSVSEIVTALAVLGICGLARCIPDLSRWYADLVRVRSLGIVLVLIVGM